MTSKELEEKALTRTQKGYHESALVYATLAVAAATREQNELLDLSNWEYDEQR